MTVLTSRPVDVEAPELETIAPKGGKGTLTIVRLPTSRLRFVGTWLHMRNLGHWLASHPLDLAYVSMLKHDAFVAVDAGKRQDFPVVLRPEGAGATGDLAWQSWGRFGSKIASRCKQADAFVAISPTVTSELKKGGYDPARIVSLPNGVPVPEKVWNRRDDWRSSPRAVFVGRLAPEKGSTRSSTPGPTFAQHFPAPISLSWAKAPSASRSKPGSPDWG